MMLSKDSRTGVYVAAFRSGHAKVIASVLKTLTRDIDHLFYKPALGSRVSLGCIRVVVGEGLESLGCEENTTLDCA